MTIFLSIIFSLRILIVNSHTSLYATPTTLIYTSLAVPLCSTTKSCPTSPSLHIQITEQPPSPPWVTIVPGSDTLTERHRTQAVRSNFPILHAVGVTSQPNHHHHPPYLPSYPGFLRSSSSRR
ncbi:proline-rich receptor-like protein kinase PERK2 [Iris pallida]|uniref:Proline-rich receptor-like protein kinase PERK2 n=1 Tax=Iris pallida TaxID=29817 RepID=A0AAX6E1S8_IRIPA|nr:proline-rich receptor-like protein kinase PERK2 [Iris pallida]